MTTLSQSAIYTGRVTHKRLYPFRHKLFYRVFSVLIDWDDLPHLHRKLKLFSYNRFNLFSFYDRDHGSRDGEALRAWTERQTSNMGLDIAGGKLLLLCYPRILGYAFNPISVLFCYDRAGILQAIIYKVRNTFGEMHSYMFKLNASSTDAILSHRAEKVFHVSPFMPIAGHYDFRITPPGDRFDLLIKQYLDNRLALVATHQARAIDLSDGNLIGCFFRYPLLTLKVIGGIHWEAAKIFFKKGAKFHKQPPAPDAEICYYSVERGECRLIAKDQIQNEYSQKIPA